MIESDRKLKVVADRLAGVAGNDARDRLLALRVTLPNRAHLLAALHLLPGRVHVALNFDVGIELVSALLTRRSDDLHGHTPGNRG